MKKYYIKALFIIALAIGAMSCESWTEVEPNVIDHVGGYNTIDDAKSEKYYEELRAWKATADNYGRPVSFGWFSNWAPAGVIRKGYLASIPDSMDIVSIWSGSFNLTQAKKEDKELVQKKKGTKILACSLLSYIGKGCTPPAIEREVREKNKDKGLSNSEMDKLVIKARHEYWGFKSGKLGSPDHFEAIAKYAKVLADSLEVNSYDGFDMDWEPGNGFNDADGTLTGSNDYILLMIKELGRYIGPKSDKGNGHKLFVIDGHVSALPAEAGEYFDYFIHQTYGASTFWIDYRFESVLERYGEKHGNTRKQILTENFESYSQDGGNLLDLAGFNSKFGPKGGVGAYRFDNDYDNSPDYKYMRQAIQLNQKAYNDYMNKK